LKPKHEKTDTLSLKLQGIPMMQQFPHDATCTEKVVEKSKQQEGIKPYL